MGLPSPPPLPPLHPQPPLLSLRSGPLLTHLAGVVAAQDWRTVIDVNLNGTYHLVHAVLPQMRAQQDGLIINVTSIAGKLTISTLAGSSYCASKFAMNSLGEAINLEEYENGIRKKTCPLPTHAT